MLKNDTLKNGTSRKGLYGSAPPPPPPDKMKILSLKQQQGVYMFHPEVLIKFFLFGIIYFSSLQMEPFMKRHKLVHNGGFPKFEVQRFSELCENGRVLSLQILTL